MSGMSYPLEGSHALRVTKDPGIIKVNNETNANSSRITREGRRITYKARIIQQPNRARACGSGAKSCADRRPVDPPPIIELKIYEGHGEQEKDITSEYHANFFMFATLEHARHMASGRAPSSGQSTVPVLTGSPVAGMALLDKPHRAGYFIFPDLSVRHEGKYRLNFSLYEELKNQKDMDSETSDVSTNGVQSRAHVSHRLEVKTIPFTVFSAKKFPGLTRSTPLSCEFASQGCRVRIRRDAKQRRKAEAKVYNDDQEDGYHSSRRPSAQPDDRHGASRPPSANGSYGDRNRAGSVASNHSHILPRRPSQDQMHPQYASGAYAQSPQMSHDVYPPSPQWPHPTEQQQQNQPSQYSAPHHHYPPPTQASAQHHPYAAASQPMAPPSYGYAPQYPHEHQHSRTNSLDFPQANQPASPRIPQSPQHVQPFGNYGAPAYNTPSYGPTPQHASIPQPAYNVPAPHYPSPHMSLRNDSVHTAAPIPMPPQEQNYYSQGISAPAIGIKRAFDSTFDSRTTQQPLRDGARPSADGKPTLEMDISIAGGDIDDVVPMEPGALSYRRADGSFAIRSLMSG